MTHSTETKTASKTALVIGITGSFGGHTAQALLKRGWRIRALARNPELAAQKAGMRTPIEWVKGDAMNPAEVLAAAEGADVIVHGANPPGYRNWRGLAVPMLRSTIAAAEQTGARIVFPGNVYNFAPEATSTKTLRRPRSPARARSASRWKICCASPASRAPGR
jgi:uncharacterized protein YbjT (DUF2867 family)